MSMGELFSPANPWFVRSVALTAAVFVATALAGFILLPYLYGELVWRDAWNAICSAAGVPRARLSVEVVKPGHKVSPAVLSVTSVSPDPESIGRGATLAQRCAICHGPTGISRADSPNLAGQYADVIYKQLVDFRAGARTNAVMSPFAT